MRFILNILVLLFLVSSTIFSQTSEIKKNNLTLSGYFDLYYCFDFNEPLAGARENFLYNHNKHNKVNVNLVYLKSNYSLSKFRANLALMHGTYAMANLAAEPAIIKNLFEANIGFKIGKRTWLDAGIFPSHIGFESAVGKDCWNLTRSILAENSPYYESGIKVTNTSESEKTTFSVLLLNGWQKIVRPKNSIIPSLGTQFIYKFNNNFSVNHSSFIGNDTPDSAFLFRFFNNFYGTYTKNKFGLIVGFDLGLQQNQINKSNLNVWYSPVAIVKYNLNSNLTLAGRAEHYNDKNQIIIKTNFNDPFDAFGVSLNLDYLIKPNILFRIEGRTLYSNRLIYNYKNTDKTNVLPFVTTSICANF